MTPPLGIEHDLGIGIFCPQSGFLTYLHDLGALVGHRTVLIVALALAVAGNEPSICYQNHVYSSFVFSDSVRVFLPNMALLPGKQKVPQTLFPRV